MYICKDMWVSMVEGRVSDKLVDYVLFPKRMPRRLLHVKVCR